MFISHRKWLGLRKGWGTPWIPIPPLSRDRTLSRIPHPTPYLWAVMALAFLHRYFTWRIVAKSYKHEVKPTKNRWTFSPKGKPGISQRPFLLHVPTKRSLTQMRQGEGSPASEWRVRHHVSPCVTWTERLCPSRLRSHDFHFLLWRWLRVMCRALGHCWGRVSGPSQEQPSFLKQQIWDCFYLALKSWQLLTILNFFVVFKKWSLSWAVVAYVAALRGRVRQIFKASLVYRAISRTARAAQRDSVRNQSPKPRILGP